MKAMKKNLKDQILTKDRKILHCKICNMETSANSGDYFMLPDNYEFTCCNEPMQLVNKIVTVRYK